MESNKFNSGSNSRTPVSKNNIFRRALAILIFTLLSTWNASASHLTAVDIYYEHIQGDSFNLILKLYRDCEGIDLGATADINIQSANCGTNLDLTLFLDSMREVSQLCPSELMNSSCNSTAPNALPGVQEFTYSQGFTFPGQCTDWILSFQDCTRNMAIDNIFDPDNQCIYVEANLNNTGGLNNNSPIFTTIPIVYSCVNKLFNFNHGGIDSDGDSLVFSLQTPLDDAGSPVNFIPPNSSTYPILDVRGFNTFDPITGEITFFPSVAQSAVTAIKVEEYRNGVLIGSTTRDLQIIITNCSNSQPSTTTGLINNDRGTLIDSTSISTCANDSINFEANYQDPDGSDQITITSNIGLVIPGATLSTIGTNPAHAYFHLPRTSFSGRKVFTVTVIDDGCSIYTAQIYTYDITFIPGTWVNEDQVIFCPGGITAQLEAHNGTVFNWRAIEGDSIIVGDNFSCNPCQNPFPTPDTATIYEVTSNVLSICGNKDTVAVRVEPGYTTTISASDSIICKNNSVQLNLALADTGTHTYSYAWTPNTNMVDGTIPNPSAVMNEETLFESYVTNDFTGCTVYDSIRIDISEFIAEVNFEDTFHLCFEDSVILEPLLYIDDPSTFNCDDYTITTIPLNTLGGTGWSTSTTANCDECVQNNIPIGFDFDFFCNSYNTLGISSNGWVSFNNLTNPAFNPESIPDPGNPNNLVAICWDDLDPDNGGTIEYKLDGTTPNRIFAVRFSAVDYFSGAGSITAEVHFLESDNSIEIHLTDVPFSGDQHTLGLENSTGTNGYSPIGYNFNFWTANNTAFRFERANPTPLTNFIYTWSPNLFLNDTNSFAPTTTTTVDQQYYVFVEDSARKCNGILDSTFIKIHQFPTIQSAISSDTVCLGDAVSLSANGATNYEWSTGNLVDSFAFTPSVSLDISVIADSGYGCAGFDTVSVFVNPLPLISINTLPSNTLCLGDSITLTASGATTYSWSTGDSISAISISPQTGQLYSVIGTDANGCLNTGFELINVNPVPELDITGNQTICENESTILLASGGNVYVWYNGDTANSIAYSSNSTGFVYVTGINVEGCSVLDSIFIIVNPAPEPQISADSLLLFGEEATLTCSPASNYDWNTGESTQVIVVSPEIDSPYIVEVVDSNGCKGSDTIQITIVNTLIIPNIITPNNDLSNDFFTIQGINNSGTLKIFNRWGKLVYVNEAYDNSFDANGLSDGTYYYVYVSNRNRAEQKGWLQVTR